MRCHGSGYVECRKCEGSGYLECQRCEGSGEEQCRRCGGAEEVEKKNGSGMKACPRCITQKNHTEWYVGRPGWQMCTCGSEGKSQSKGPCEGGRRQCLKNGEPCGGGHSCPGCQDCSGNQDDY